MYIDDDEELLGAVKNTIKMAHERGYKITITTASDDKVNPTDEEGNPNINYSTHGNSPISSTYHTAMYADYAGDLMDALGRDKAIEILDRHMVALTETYWANLENISKGAH